MTRYYRIELCKAWWWTWLYVPGVMFLAGLGMTLDWDTVSSMAARASRIRLVRVHPGVEA